MPKGLDSVLMRQETPQFVLPIDDVDMIPAFEDDKKNTVVVNDHWQTDGILPEEITSIGVIADKNAEVSRAMVSVDKNQIKNLSDSVTS